MRSISRTASGWDRSHRSSLTDDYLFEPRVELNYDRWQARRRSRQEAGQLAEGALAARSNLSHLHAALQRILSLL